MATELSQKMNGRRDALANLLLQFPGLVKTLIRWGFVYLMFREASTCIGRFAGSTTFTEFRAYLFSNFISMELKVQLTLTLSWAMTITAVVYGLVQRRQRRLSIKNKQTHVVALESKLDPGRSSSGIGEMGGTNPEDR